ncbi:uncharacterized protein EI97DRAFT_438423 [Westerdykella ornata]|uniref:Uncharacterized protein n=1 Tax=Westerdykella ornata TaxID=318751 RepID=A0A6A6JXR8_WESOR|nr:uncharacterized protein EI97DRAFT_438423 [Westerdykella ornata]KAF2281015.1 hypothetical protein EI97DRAFT_438423 [Westerdykella ornata]
MDAEICTADRTRPEGQVWRRAVLVGYRYPPTERGFILQSWRITPRGPVPEQPYYVYNGQSKCERAQDKRPWEGESRVSEEFGDDDSGHWGASGARRLFGASQSPAEVVLRVCDASQTHRVDRMGNRITRMGSNGGLPGISGSSVAFSFSIGKGMGKLGKLDASLWLCRRQGLAFPIHDSEQAFRSALTDVVAPTPYGALLFPLPGRTLTLAGPNSGSSSTLSWPRLHRPEHTVVADGTPNLVELVMQTLTSVDAWRNKDSFHDVIFVGCAFAPGNRGFAGPAVPRSAPSRVLDQSRPAFPCGGVCSRHT